MKESLAKNFFGSGTAFSLRAVRGKVRRKGRRGFLERKPGKELFGDWCSLLLDMQHGVKCSGGEQRPYTVCFITELIERETL